MTPSGLMITQEQGVTVVTFYTAAIREMTLVESVRTDLHALVDQQARKKIVLDFTGVEFLTTPMFGVMITLQSKARGIGGRVVICGLRPDFKKAVEAAQMHKILEFAAEQKAALASFGVLGQA